MYIFYDDDDDDDDDIIIMLSVCSHICEGDAIVKASVLQIDYNADSHQTTLSSAT